MSDVKCGMCSKSKNSFERQKPPLLAEARLKPHLFSHHGSVRVLRRLQGRGVEKRKKNVLLHARVREERRATHQTIL